MKKLNNFKIEFIGDEILFNMIKGLVESTTEAGIVLAKKLPKKRSNAQNRTLHGWLGAVAEEAKNKGLTIDYLWKNPTMVLVNEHQLKIFTKQVVTTLVDHDNTSKLDTKTFSELVDILEKVFAERLGNEIPYKYKD